MNLKYLALRASCTVSVVTAVITVLAAGHKFGH
jgi:hypothetical protein